MDFLLPRLLNSKIFSGGAPFHPVTYGLELNDFDDRQICHLPIKEHGNPIVKNESEAAYLLEAHPHLKRRLAWLFAHCSNNTHQWFLDANTSSWRWDGHPHPWVDPEILDPKPHMQINNCHLIYGGFENEHLYVRTHGRVSYGVDSSAEGPDLKKDPAYRNPNMCPSGRVYVKMCRQRVRFYIQDLSFERNIITMKENTFYFVPSTLAIGWYNNKNRTPFDKSMLVLCFEVKTSYQSMAQTRECYVPPFKTCPHVELNLHHMPWFSNDDFVDVVDRDMLPIYAGVERGGSVRLGVTGTHSRLLLAYHHLIQETSDRHESDDDEPIDWGSDDSEMKLKGYEDTEMELKRKRKREDNDCTESEFNQELPSATNQSFNTVVENEPPKQDDYGDREAATPGVPKAASMPQNNNNDCDSDDSHAKKMAARRNKSAKSSVEPGKPPDKQPAKGSKDAKKKAARQKKIPKSSEETVVSEPSKNSATPSQDDSKLRQAIHKLTSGEGKKKGSGSKVTNQSLQNETITQKVKKASIDKVPASRPGPPPPSPSRNVRLARRKKKNDAASPATSVTTRSTRRAQRDTKSNKQFGHTKKVAKHLEYSD
jgi:hypothetical protein